MSTTPFTILLLLSLLFVKNGNAASKSTGPTKKCADESCTQILFEVKAVRHHVSNHADFLEFKPDEIVKVFAIHFSDRPDLWEGQNADGKKGFFFSSHVDRENYVNFLRTAVDKGLTLHVLTRDPRAKPDEKYVGKVSASETLNLVRQVEENNLALAKGEPAPHVIKPPKPPSAHSHSHSHSHDRDHGHSHDDEDHSHSHAAPSATPIPPVPKVEPVAKVKEVALPEEWIRVKGAAQMFLKTGEFTELELKNAEDMIRTELEAGRDGGIMLELMAEKLKDTMEKKKIQISAQKVDGGKNVDGDAKEPPVKNQEKREENVGKAGIPETNKGAKQEALPEKIAQNLETVTPMPTGETKPESGKIPLEEAPKVTEQENAASPKPITLETSKPVDNSAKPEGVQHNKEYPKTETIDIQQKPPEIKSINPEGKKENQPQASVPINPPAVTEIPVKVENHELPPEIKGNPHSQAPVETPSAPVTTAIPEVAQTQVPQVLPMQSQQEEKLNQAPPESVKVEPVQQQEPVQNSGSVNPAPQATENSKNNLAGDAVDSLISKVKATNAPGSAGESNPNPTPTSVPPAISLASILSHDSEIPVGNNPGDVESQPERLGGFETPPAGQQEEQVTTRTPVEMVSPPPSQAPNPAAPETLIEIPTTTPSPTFSDEYPPVSPQINTAQPPMHFHDRSLNIPAPPSGHETDKQQVVPPNVEEMEKHSEIKDEFGQEYCIKGDCGKDEKKVENYPEDPGVSGSFDYVKQSLPPGYEQNGIREKVSSFRSTFKPMINLLNGMIGFIRKLLPKSTQQAMIDMGIDNLAFLMTLIPIFATIFFFLARCFSSSSGLKRRVDLHRCARVFQEKKALEVENEQLRKREAEIQEAGVASQEEFKEAKKAREKAEDKASRLKQEIVNLQNSNEFLDKELKKDREEMMNLKEKTEAAKEKREKIEKESKALKKQNESLSAQVKEFRESCERSRERAEKLEKELDEKTRELKEKHRNLSSLEISTEQLRTKSEEVEAEAEELGRQNRELEVELSGLKAIVENLNIPLGAGQSTDPTDSAGSANGWEDIGGSREEDKEKRRLQLAELKNVAQLHAKIKQTKEELEKSRSICQKETDLRVSLDSQLKLCQDDVAKLRDKLDLADTERRDLLTQVKKMTEMVASKDKEVQSRVDDLNKKLDKLREENDRLQSEYSYVKSEKEMLDKKYRDTTETLSKLKRELEKTEASAYHELKSKETQIRQMKMDMMTMSMPKRPDSTGAPESPGAMNPSSHSSEAEMKQFSPRGMDVSSSSGGFMVDDIWTLPAASRGPRHWEEPYDSPPSSVDYAHQHEDTRRRPKSKTKASSSDKDLRRKTASPALLLDSGGENKDPKNRRSRSRGGERTTERDRSRSPEPLEPASSKPKRRAKSKGRSPLDPYSPYGASAGMYGPPHGGFDPYFGPPPPEYYGRRGHYYSSGGSATGGRSPPPPQMPLVGGLPPPGVKEVKATKPRPKSSAGAKMS